MWKLKPRRAATVVATIGACALLPAYGARQNPGSGSRGAMQAHKQAATLVFHITGLVLIVPNQNGGADALLPETQDLPEKHVSRLGFGIDKSDPNAAILCAHDTVFKPTTPLQRGICYVDLDEWSLDPVGQDGMPAHPGPLPRSVFNVSEASGGKHKVHLPWVEGQLRSKISFVTGEAGALPCALANWRYRPITDILGIPISGFAQREPLANVVDWKIENPSSYTLTFRPRKSSGPPVTVALQPPQDGMIELLLVHIPEKELGDLPPNAPRSALATSSEPAASAMLASDTVATHFHAYYNLLRGDEAGDSISHGNHRRVLPHKPHPEHESNYKCPIRITALPRILDDNRNIGTYACMPATSGP